MSAMIPMAVYGLEVPCGDLPVPANVDGIPAAFRITMAAIDPTAEPEEGEGDIPRATLKIIRQSLTEEDDDDDEDEDEDFDVSKYDDMFLGEGESDDEEESDDEDLTGGPSDPAKSKKARKAAAQKEIAALLAGDDMEVDEAPNGVNGVKKSAKALGKMPASDDSEDDDEDDEEDDEDDEIEEFVVCTLDPTKNYQQALDITVGERERVFFVVSGTHSIFLTGNYVEPAENLQGSGMYDPDSDEEDDYDLEPDSDELELVEGDESDELDDLEDPRVTELSEEEDEAPQLIKAAEKKQEKKKGKNKRPAEDEEEVADAETIDALIANEAAKAKVNGEAKLSKKQAKKLKKNDGSAAAVEEAKKEADAPSSNKADKKVSFAKELEQGPTPTKDSKDDKSKAALGVKVVQGVTLDDKKLGKGPAAKNGDRVGMRYIGKLQKDNSVFDSNKKGKPFTFKLGAGEVIKGWDIGIQGMSAGGERRITIPPHHGYGSKGVPGIPSNSTLVFDVKVVEIHRK